MKQFLTYALALVVILGAGTAASDGAQAFLLSGQTQTVPAVGDEEFVGPFPSWANVKTNYGAAGDGVTDDTAAIQNALNALGPNHPTLYFPAGTYRITQTLTLASQIYVNIIGQDPVITTILWGGASGGTMFYQNGVAYSRFDRLTFNGQGNAAIAVDESKADNSSNYFDDGNEYTDDVFENAGIGLRCGALGYGCADVSMLRDQFLSNTVSGIMLGNFNALDMWVWYSFFQNNAIGVGNLSSLGSGAGNFHVYNSVFEHSSSADIMVGNTGVFDFINNYSSGSQYFYYAGGNNSPNPVLIEGNTIVNTTNAVSVTQANLGPMILLDNIITNSATLGPVVNSRSDLFSMGNTFTASSPESVASESPAGAVHYHTVNDQVVSSVNTTMPTLPGTPPNFGRQIFEVTPGSTTSQIQTVINNAAACGCTNPVVHIQPGSYSIGTTLTVPANFPIQIIGDGGNSLLTWTGSGSGPVLQLAGPSRATLRDFNVNGNGASRASGIEIDNADQPGSWVFLEQTVLGSSATNLLVDGLDYTTVEAHGLNHVSAVNVGVQVVGGSQAAVGNWQGGSTNIFTGDAALNNIGYAVSNGGHLAIRATWSDVAGAAEVGEATDNSVFSYAGSWINRPGGAAIVLKNFTGTGALVGVLANGTVNITGTGSGANDLVLGLVGAPPSVFNDSSSPDATIEFLNGFYECTGFFPPDVPPCPNPNPGVGAFELAEQGSADPTFLATTLRQLRTTQPTTRPGFLSAVTNVYISRVNSSSAITGIRIAR